MEPLRLSSLEGRHRLMRSGVTLLALLSSQALGLLVSVLIARLLNKTDAGVVFFATGLVTISMAFTTLGLSSASRYYYLRNKNRKRGHRNVQIVFMAALVAILPSAGLSLFGLTIAGDVDGSLALFLGTLAVSCYFATFRQLAQHLFIAENKRASSLVYDAIIFNAGFLVYLLLVPQRTVDAALWGLLGVSIAAGSIALVQLVGHIGSQLPERPALLPPGRYARTILAIAIPSMIAQAGGVLLNKIDVVMIGPLAGAVAVGDYSVALRLTYVTALGGTILMALVTGRLIRVSVEGSAAQVWATMRKFTLLQAGLVLALSLPMFIFAEPIITLVYGENYASSAGAFILLQAGKVLTAVFAPALVMYTALGYNRDLARVMVLVVVVNIGLNFLLIPSMGAMGAAWATLAGLAIMSGNYVYLMLRVRRRHIDERAGRAVS
jgi:O-antigen/teichoic acid export membrane protein